MTGKKSILIIGLLSITALLGYIFVSQFTSRTLPSVGVKTVAECEMIGQIINQDDPTTCILKVSDEATTTVTTSPQETPPPPIPSNTDATQKLNTDVSFKITEQKKYTDVLTVTLNSISDSRCKPDVQCIWAGELAAEFSITGGSFGTTVTSLSLGTVRNTTKTMGGYTFTLVTATEQNVTLNISKISATTAKGTVQGKVTISPICPVERLDEPCITPPETYTLRTVVVYGPAEFTKIRETALSGDGTYSLSLAPGNYWLQIEPAGIGPGEKKPVTIKINSTSTIDFDIDSGIR